VPFHLVSHEGRTLHLTVQAGGPPCDEVTSVHVDETPRTVTVTVRPGTAAILGTFPVEVRLRHPLGSRTLRDGAA
jgi:hypothetical protein